MSQPQPKAATDATRRAHERVRASLPADTKSDFELAKRGFIATLPNARIEDASGKTVWDMGPFGFCAEDTPCPDTVNPSLWRQAQLNTFHGLFEVTPGIYQVRNFDISNITFIEGERGYIVIDPLISAETAAAALKLMREQRGDKPVTAVIYTHSHVDHFGGILGVISESDIAGGMTIIAPEGFLEAAVSENVLLGNVMSRRATYMYGGLLEPGPQGHVDSGLGKTVSKGVRGLVPPTRSITQTGERLSVDGVEIVFQVTPDTEAPAEMNFFFPQFDALCMAENCSCHLHNLYTPRGAQVRDANAWSYYINEAIELFAANTQVLFASHHWPRWGKEVARDFLVKQRDMYKYVHDQTLRLANHGLTPREIAEDFELPETLASEWYTRGYYGTLSHNTKAVYQRYLGWFDGNPANLNRLPPVDVGRRYVDAVGGPDVLLEKARSAFETGDYRWVAELVNHLVFAEPDNQAARQLQADALEQLGYQAEAGPWRAFYLTGALELRNPRPDAQASGQGTAGEARGIPVADLLKSLAVRINGPKAGAREITLNLSITDTQETFVVWLENAVLHHSNCTNRADTADRLNGRDADASLALDRATLADLVLKGVTLDAALTQGRVQIDGDRQAATALIDLLDDFDFWFEIALP